MIWSSGHVFHILASLKWIVVDVSAAFFIIGRVNGANSWTVWFVMELNFLKSMNFALAGGVKCLPAKLSQIITSFSGVPDPIWTWRCWSLVGNFFVNWILSKRVLCFFLSVFLYFPFIFFQIYSPSSPVVVWVLIYHGNQRCSVNCWISFQWIIYKKILHFHLFRLLLD